LTPFNYFQEILFLSFPLFVSQRTKYVGWTAAPQPMLCTTVFHCGQIKIGKNDWGEQQSVCGDT